MILRQRSNMRASVGMQCDAAWPWWCRLDSSASVSSSPRVTDFLLPDHISCGMLTRFCQKSLQNSNTGRLKGQQTMLKANTDLLLDARSHARKRTHRPDSGNLDRYQNPNTIQTNRERERFQRIRQVSALLRCVRGPVKFSLYVCEPDGPLPNFPLRQCQTCLFSLVNLSSSYSFY